MRISYSRQLLVVVAAFLTFTAQVASAAASAELRVGEYYRPKPPEVSGRVGTTAAYRRSPCPAINALANHGYIPRDGKDISAQVLKEAVMRIFNIDNRYADTLVALAKKPVFNLDELSLHNNVEHDMSLVHKDAFFGDDPASVDADLVADTFGHVGASDIMDSWFFARTQQRRLRECIDHNPQCEFSNEYLLSVTLGRHGLLMRVMGAKNEEAVDMQVAKAFLINETFPQPWARSSKAISQNDIQDTRIRLSALLKASGEWLGDGFGSTPQQLISDSNSKLCLAVSAPASVVVAACDSASESQKFQLDDVQRLVTAKGLCIQTVNGSDATGFQLAQVECSQDVKATQQWRYDASGRLRPFQAPDSCIDLAKTQANVTSSSVKVVTAACSTRTEQRFYALYANFQPSVSLIASMYAREFCLGVESSATTSSALDLSPVVMDTCNELSDAQQFTLDDSRRLVFQYDTSQCVDVSEDSASAVVQKPCSGSTTTWHYDSLGRLHPGSDLMKCLSFPSDPDKDNKVRLSDCMDELIQKWFVATTKNADIRPKDQYYRPNVFESSGKPGTAAAYRRSPCPALNTLANHGLLPRSGRNLTAEQVRQAVVDHFNIDPAYAQVLVGLAKKTLFDLDELSIHNSAEQDMSLVHADAFFGQDPAVTDTTLIADLMGHVGAAGYMDTIFFARTQARRLKDCQARNPQCDFSNEFLTGVALGRLGLLMRGFGGDNKNLASIENVRAFLVDEKFPAGFKKSPTPITQADIQETRSRVSSLLKSSREWLVDGFASSSRSVNVVSEGGGHALCFEISKGSTDSKAPLTVAPCDASKSEQTIFLDDKQRLVVEKSKLCLATSDHSAAVGSPVVQLECSDDASNQFWRYDASGRLRPAHAATLCLEVGSKDTSTGESGNVVTLQSCGNVTKQRFYSFFDNFHANASHLNSIENPERCVGGAAGSVSEAAPVDASTCDSGLIEQQVTLDAKRRLVFRHSNKCITRVKTNQDKALVQATCGDDASQQWRYDSLGRLHSVSNSSLCIALGASSSTGPPPPNLPVVLAECSDSGLQMWYASDANDPNSRPQNAYYRPDRDESSGKLGNSATYSRSPCPALNALANHGIISRDGRNISRADLMGAVVATFNIEQALAERMVGSITDEYINLDQFSDPAVFSYQGSVLHNDQFFNPDPAAVDPDFVSDLFAHVSRSEIVDLVYLTAAQRRRVDIYARDTGTSTVNLRLNELKYMAPGLVLRLMGGKNEETASSSAMKMLLVEERMPEGYAKPSVPVTLSDALSSAGKVQALIETGGASSTGPGGSSEAWLSKPFHPQKEQIFVTAKDGNGVLCLQLTNATFILATCDTTKVSQHFTYDELQRLVVEETGSCLDVIDGKLDGGARVSHTDCVDWPHQKWTYDSSGRLHPQHGPKFCLEAAVGSKAVINKCSERDEQVFFAAFSKLSLYDKQLISAGVSSPSSTGQLTQCISSSTRSGASGGISTEQCNAASPTQLFTLNDALQLVAAGSNRCLGLADAVTLPAGGSTVSLGTCAALGAATDLQKWTYDSLGRLHLTQAMGLCLSKLSGAVSLEGCSFAASQQWIVATLTASSPATTSGGGNEAASATSPVKTASFALLLASAVAVLVS